MSFSGFDTEEEEEEEGEGEGGRPRRWARSDEEMGAGENIL